MKKLLCIAALLTLLSGCVVIDSRYTGRRCRVRVRPYRHVTYVYPAYGWYWYPYRYYGRSWGYMYYGKAKRGDKVYKRQIKKSTHTSTTRIRKTASSPAKTTSKGTGTRVKKK